MQFIFEVVGTVDSPIPGTTENDIKTGIEEAITDAVVAINQRFSLTTEERMVKITFDRIEVEREEPTVDSGIPPYSDHDVPPFGDEPPDVGAPINEDRQQTSSPLLDLLSDFADLAIEKIEDAAHKFLDERQPPR